MSSSYVKDLAKRLVENTRYDKESGTLFVTNPGISPEVLKAIAIKNNFKIGQLKTGEYISIPRGAHGDFFKDKIVSQYQNFMETYTNYSKDYGTLMNSYKVYDQMEENLSEVGLILSTYVEEVLSQGFIENPVLIKINNAKAQDFVLKVLENNKFFSKLPAFTKMIAKYGNAGITISYPYLEDNRAEILDPELQANIKHINVEKDLTLRLINPKYFKVNCDEYLNPINYETSIDNSYSYTNQTVTIKHRIWQQWQFVHGLIEDEDTAPYGKSILWSLRSAFDQLSTLEALLAISRASRLQRLVISLPMPNGIGVTDAWQYMNELISNYNNSIFTYAPGAKNGKKIPAATEVLYKPAIEGFDISTIEAKIDLSSTEDVEYFLDKILRNSKLPKGYLIGDDVLNTGQTLEAQDLKFARALIPLRTALVNALIKLVECILVHGGFNVSDLIITVDIEKPIQVSGDTLAKYSDILELLKSALEINNIPAINRYQLMLELGMDEKIARLLSSKTSIMVTKNIDNVTAFLKDQIVMNLTDAPTGNAESEDEEQQIKDEFGESLREPYKKALNLNKVTFKEAGREVAASASNISRKNSPLYKLFKEFNGLSDADKKAVLKESYKEEKISDTPKKA